MVPNLHTVAVRIGILCVHCKSCGHRAALERSDKLEIHKGSMRELRSLKMRSEQCGTRGTALKEFDFYTPFTLDEAKAFMAGEAIENRKVDV
jgi:hypothetical protein